MRKESQQTIFRHGAYEMRSHSETRWAAMMDALRVTWLYEPQTVQTRHGGYMPDFYLPAAGVFVEVKGPRPSQVEREKALDAQSATGCPVIFVYGRPEMINGELFHGLISYFGTYGEITYSTAEIGSAIRKHWSLATYAAYITAGEHQKRPHVIRVGEGLEELITSWMERGDREKYLRNLHFPLNRAKTERFAQHSEAEWALGEFAKKLNERWAAQEAA